jgi:hypothetical protein
VSGVRGVVWVTGWGPHQGGLGAGHVLKGPNETLNLDALKILLS